MTYQVYKNKTISTLSIAGLAVTLGLAGCSNNDTTETTTNADGTPAAENQNIELLNVSYDVARDFYKDYNPMFVEHYKSENPNATVNIKQSHGGSSKQALSVANGLQADVATM
ncbi:sulfate ABC transporter substrate-binding protein, partial [Psychrobacter sp. T6-1]